MHRPVNTLVVACVYGVAAGSITGIGEAEGLGDVVVNRRVRRCCRVHPCAPAELGTSEPVGACDNGFRLRVCSDPLRAEAGCQPLHPYAFNGFGVGTGRHARGTTTSKQRICRCLDVGWWVSRCGNWVVFGL